MLTSGLRANTCGFCSVVFKRNGKGPIDAVCPTDEYLLLEVTPPRPTSTWIQSGAMTPAGLIGCRKSATIKMPHFDTWQSPRYEYSHPGYARGIPYCRPRRQVASLRSSLLARAGQLKPI